MVLLDVVLSKMDGFDVLTYMNKNHWIEDIPVIMMSGADAPEAVKRAYALGAVDFVSKPCDAQIVYQRVTNTMKLYAKQRRLTSLITAQINEKEKNSEMLIHILSHIVEFRTERAEAMCFTFTNLRRCFWRDWRRKPKSIIWMGIPEP